MASPGVTIVVVARERFSASARTLASIYAHTRGPFHLVYVSAGTPPSLLPFLREEADRKGFHLTHTDTYLSPNRARNLALAQVRTKFVVFLDNDALVAPGWLDALVRCAEETGASIVGPLYFIGELEDQVVHVAGGRLHLDERQGRRVLRDEQRHFDTPLARVSDGLARGPCDYAEFHCMLVRADVFSRLGPLDEALLSVHEHLDLSMGARAAGGTVYFEPAARTSYLCPLPYEWSDLPFFMLRWSDAWTTSSIRHFGEKWQVFAVRHFHDNSPLDQGDTLLGFARGHRRRTMGLRLPPEGERGWSPSPADEARLMVALFQSVDRESFDLAVTAADGHRVELEPGLHAEGLLARLPPLLDEAEATTLGVTVRACSRGVPQEPLLVRIDDLDASGRACVEPHAFLTLEMAPGRYQCWLAVAQRTWRDGATVRGLVGGRAGGAPGGSDGASTIAGSRLPGRAGDAGGGPRPRVRLAGGVVGHLATPEQLTTATLAPYLWAAHLA